MNTQAPSPTRNVRISMSNSRYLNKDDHLFFNLFFVCVCFVYTCISSFVTDKIMCRTDLVKAEGLP